MNRPGETKTVPDPETLRQNFQGALEFVNRLRAQLGNKELTLDESQAIGRQLEIGELLLRQTAGEALGANLNIKDLLGGSALPAPTGPVAPQEAPSGEEGERDLMQSLLFGDFLRGPVNAVRQELLSSDSPRFDPQYGGQFR